MCTGECLLDMDGKRLLGSFAVFGVLALVFSGVSGFATATTEHDVIVPLPKAGDAASYTIREVIDDEELAQGQVLFNWARVAWRDEVEMPDETGTTAQFAPMDFTLRFREGSKYQMTFDRRTYHEIASRTAYLDEYQYEGYVEYGQQFMCINGGCLSQRHASDTYTTYRSANGPVGMCGALTDLHGADIPPKTMEVTGYCRDVRTIDDEQTTPYKLVDETTWKGRDAVVYEAPETGFRITYATGFPFPVKMDVPFSEYLSEAYALARHFEIELRDYTPGDLDYPARMPRAAGQPVDLVPRVPILQIDETGLTGFTLGKAYQAAMQDTQSPRLSDFMQRPGAYIGGAWKNSIQDSDGNEILYWTLFATDGERDMGKMIRQESPAKLATVELDWQGTEQYSVSGVSYEAGVHFPPQSRLPSSIASVREALDRATAYPGVGEPNIWGFYTHCENDGCTDVTTAVRAGRELLPSNGMQFGTQGAPPFHQYMVFFNQHGYLSHTWTFEGEKGQDGLLPVNNNNAGTTPEATSSSGSSLWAPPPAAAAVSLGFVAVFGGLLYYFWPMLKVGGIGMFTRIKDDDLLRHPRRRAIHDAIGADPGIHFQELSRAVGSGRGSLDHHLRKLEAGGLVVRQTDKGSTSFFAKGAVDRRVMAATSLLRAPSTRRVLDSIVGRPGIQCADIAAQTGLSNATVSYHLGKLRNQGIITRGRQLALTPEGESLLTMAA